MTENSPKRLIIGISGASGAIYGIRLLEVLKDTDIETHLVISDAAKLTIAQETEYKIAEIEALADVIHDFNNVGASISSGSFKTIGMVIAPCSMRSMSEIAAGITSNLLTRSADVILKERRRLVLMVRETPFHAIHLRNMTALSEIGAIIAPPLPAFYNNPKSIDDIVNSNIAKVLDLFGIESTIMKRWEGCFVSPLPLGEG